MADSILSECAELHWPNMSKSLNLLDISINKKSDRPVTNYTSLVGFKNGASGILDSRV